MGSITQAMQKACIDAGVQITTDAAVKKVLVNDNKAIGIELENGDVIHASKIISNLNPTLLYKKLIDSADLDDEFNKSMDGYKSASV